MKNKNPTGFRLWPENTERIEYAKRIGLNASEVVNEVLAKHLKPFLESAKADQAKRMKSALAESVP